MEICGRLSLHQALRDPVGIMKPYWSNITHHLARNKPTDVELLRQRPNRIRALMGAQEIDVLMFLRVCLVTARGSNKNRWVLRVHHPRETQEQEPPFQVTTMNKNKFFEPHAKNPVKPASTKSQTPIRVPFCARDPKQLWLSFLLSL